MELKKLYLFAIVINFLISCQTDPVNPPTTPVLLKDTTINNISYGQADIQKLDLGLPANRTEKTPLVVVIHGGGWFTGDKGELTWLLNGLKLRGFAVANINYRLNLNTADNYKMQLDDVDSAVQFILKQASVYHFNNQKIYIAGHSAGGHLSLCYAYSRNPNGIVKAVGSLAGPADLFAMSYYNYTLYNQILTPYLGISLFPSSVAATQRYKDCSPRYQATINAPPTIFFHGENDPVVFTDQSTSMYAVLGTLNVDRKIIMYPLTFHDWWADGTKTTDTMDQLKNWFNNHL